MLLVVLNGKSSQKFPIYAGFSQGSILCSTFMFSMMIVICNITFYTDDTTLISKFG